QALALLDRPTEWIFNKTRNFDRPADEGTYLSMVISASRPYATMSKEELLALVLKDVQECIPEARQAKVVKSHVIRCPKPTLSPQPGIDALRPNQRSPISNLFVAGEWTRTGWPSTMESAARSGYLAAERLLEAAGRPQRLLAADLPVSTLARLLERR